MVEVHTPEKTDIVSQDICYPDNPVAVRSHHWTIETPQGETSSGECKNCHITRDFRNSQDSRPWEDQAVKNSWDSYKLGQTGYEVHE